MANFFDKVVVGFNQGINSVSESSKIFMEKAKLNTQIQDVEREKTSLLQNIGLLIYNLQESGELTVEQCSGMCSEIKKADEQIAFLKKQIQELEMQKGQAASYNQGFTNQPAENGIRCECGNINKSSAKFCAKCGKAISE